MTKVLKDKKTIKLRDGEGEINRNGKVSYRYRKRINGEDVCIYGATLQELRKKVKDYKPKEALPKEADMSLNDAFRIYMSINKVSRGTKANYTKIWQLHVADKIGRYKVLEINQIMIKAYYAELADKGYSNSTIKDLHNLIKPTLEMLYQDMIIMRNPARISIKSYGYEKREKRVLTLDEQSRLLEFMRESIVYSKYYNMVQLELEIGLRMGELLGLQWSDIDLEHKTINVNHQLVYKNYGDGSKLYIEKPKTKAGNRVIRMSKNAYNAMIGISDDYHNNGFRCYTDVDGYNDFVFITCFGSPIMPSAYNDILYNIVRSYNKRASVNGLEPLPHISSHTLRHTACTNLARKRIDPKALQYIMGHSSISMTMDVYNHLGVSEHAESEIIRLDNDDF